MTTFDFAKKIRRWRIKRLVREHQSCNLRIKDSRAMWRIMGNEIIRRVYIATGENFESAPRHR